MCLFFLPNFCFFFSPRATVVAVATFLDAFQKVADLATNSRGRNMPTHFEALVYTVISFQDCWEPLAQDYLG